MNKTYSNQDFYLSAFLMTSGCRMLSNKRINGITIFSFEDNNYLQKLVSDYYSFQATCEPMAYGNAIRSLKSVIHSSNSKESNYNANRAV